MRKVYEKPQLFAESFELTEHIGQNCNPDVFSLTTHRNSSDCYVDFDGLHLFMSDTKQDCNFDQDEEGWPELYWGFDISSTTDGEKLFAS